MGLSGDSAIFYRSMVKRSVLLAVAGLIAGLAIGLALGWWVWPVQYYDTDISSLHPEFKLDYVAMVGAAYEQDGNWDKVQVRLEALGEPEIDSWIRDLILQSIAEGRDPITIRHMVGLAGPLGISTDVMEPFSGN